MSNTVQWSDPDTVQGSGNQQSPGVVYIADPVTKKVISPATSSSAPATDTYQSGTLTAAQPAVGTPVAGGTVTIALGQGQAVVEVALTGTFSAGTTAIFEGTEDSGVTTNWFPMFGQDTGVANPPNISSIAGGASKLIRIPSMGYAQVRIRANPFAGGDSVAVRLAASVAGSGMAGALSTNDNTFATQTTAAAAKTDLDNINTVEGAITDTAVVGDVNGTHSAKLRGLSKILNAVWDSVNNLLNTNTSRVGGTAIDTNSGTKSAGTQRVVLATDQPALTNKLLVTPDSVALPLHQSVNVDQWNGTAPDTNSGSKSAGTLRVVVATDQPALTNAQPANHAQVAGTTTSVNAGNRDAGTQRIIESGNPTPTVTQVASAAIDTSILAANANKKGTLFFNDSTQILYLLYGTGVASTTNYSVQISPKAYFEDPLHYTGGFHGIWAAANGNVYCTEVS